MKSMIEHRKTDLKTEEDVKIKFLMPYLRNLGYIDTCCAFNVSIEIHEGRKQKQIFADVIVYASPEKKTPLFCAKQKGQKKF